MRTCLVISKIVEMSAGAVAPLVTCSCVPEKADRFESEKVQNKATVTWATRDLVTARK
jgi:hypothetical protein